LKAGPIIRPICRPEKMIDKTPVRSSFVVARPIIPITDAVGPADQPKIKRLAITVQAFEETAYKKLPAKIFCNIFKTFLFLLPGNL